MYKLLLGIIAIVSISMAANSGQILLKSVQTQVSLNNGNVTLYCDVDPSTPVPGKGTGYWFSLVIASGDIQGLKDGQKALQADLLSALNSGLKVEVDYNDLGSSGQMYAVRVFK